MARPTLTFPGALEEEPHHQNLQCSHTNHHADFDQAEIENPLLCTLHRAEIAVLSRSEILLHPADGRQLRGDLEYCILQGRVLGRICAAFLRDCRVLGFVLDLERPLRQCRAIQALRLGWQKTSRIGPSYRDLKVHHLVGERAHLVAETKLVLAHLLCGKDIVSLSLFDTRQDLLVSRSVDFVVDIEGAARLDLMQAVSIKLVCQADVR